MTHFMTAAERLRAGLKPFARKKNATSTTMLDGAPPSKKRAKCVPCNKLFQKFEDLQHHNEDVHPTKPKKRKNKGGTAGGLKVEMNTQFEKSVESLLTALGKSNRDGEEFVLFLRHVQPKAEDMIDIHQRIQADLNMAFMTAFGEKVKISLYGSAVSGLSMKDSDFDFHVELKNAANADGKAIVSSVAKALRSMNCFRNIVPIPNARTPIVKFVHIKTGFSCDLNMSNPIGIHNSKFLSFVIRFDPRIHLFAMILKYWAKVNRFSNPGAIRNYALTLLIIFYLQNAEPAVLPPIEELQEDAKRLIVSKHWNMGFNQKFVNKTENKMSVPELLEGFFKFYKDFAFETEVICPLTGKSIPKTAFKAEEIENLPESLVRYKAYYEAGNSNPKSLLHTTDSICVQDPFELSHNTTYPTSKTFLPKFRHFLNSAAAYFTPEITTAQLLIKLFTAYPQNSISSNVKLFVEQNSSELICKLNRTRTEMKYARKLWMKKEEPKKSESNAEETDVNKNGEPTKIDEDVEMVEVTPETEKVEQKAEAEEPKIAAQTSEEIEKAKEDAEQKRIEIELTNEMKYRKVWADHTMTFLRTIFQDVFLFNITDQNTSDLPEKELKCQDHQEINMELSKFVEIETDVDCWTKMRQFDQGNEKFKENVIAAAKQLKEVATKCSIKQRVVFRVPLDNDYIEINFIDAKKDDENFMKFFKHFSLYVRGYILGWYIAAARE